MAEPGRKTQRGFAFLAQASLDPALVALGSGQWGVFTLEQICALGVTAAAVRARAANGRLHRIYRGVYALVPPELLTRNGRWLAAVYACGPGAVLSHRTAAALHELRKTDAVRIDVTVPGRTRRVQPGINVHRSTTLTARDVTVVQNLPCTSIARTQFDIAEAINRRGVERAFDQADSMEVFDLRALNDQLDRNSTRPAAKVVRSVLDEHYVGSTLTWSELEERFLALLRLSGFPLPEINGILWLPDGGPPIRPDFMWRAERVLVETDGRKYHGTRQARERDNRRDQRTTVAGWKTIRTTKRQLEREPEVVVAVAAALMNG